MLTFASLLLGDALGGLLLRALLTVVARVGRQTPRTLLRASKDVIVGAVLKLPPAARHLERELAKVSERGATTSEQNNRFGA